MNKSYVGFCHNIKHKGYLTIELIAEHQCVEKGCAFFRVLDHPLWKDPGYHTQKVSSKKLKRIRDIIQNPEDYPNLHRQLKKFTKDSDTNPKP